MKKAVMIVGAVVAVAVIVIGAVLIYAARNLNSIIAEREPVLLQKVSDSLGRKVEVESIKASLGWGLVAELTGLKIEDDPALSDRPFIEASEASAKVDLLPLLSRRIHVTEVTLKDPVVRIIRTEQGELNVSTIGKKSGAEKEPPPAQTSPGSMEQAPITSESGTMTAKPEKRRGAENLAAVYVQSLLVDNGVIVYEERGANTQTVSINDVVLSVKDFRVTRAFDFTLKLAILSDKQNVDISGTAGHSRRTAPWILKTLISLLRKRSARSIWPNCARLVPSAKPFPRRSRFPTRFHSRRMWTALLRPSSFMSKAI